MFGWAYHDIERSIHGLLPNVYMFLCDLVYLDPTPSRLVSMSSRLIPGQPPMLPMPTNQKFVASSILASSSQTKHNTKKWHGEGEGATTDRAPFVKWQWGIWELPMGYLIVWGASSRHHVPNFLLSIPNMDDVDNGNGIGGDNDICTSTLLGLVRSNLPPTSYACILTHKIPWFAQCELWWPI